MEIINGEKVYDERDDGVLIPPVQGHIERDWKKDPYASFAAAFPPELMVDKSNWSAAIKEKKEMGALNSQLWIRSGKKALHQQQTSMCWMFAVFSNIIMNRLKAGMPDIRPSPASAAAPCMDFRDNGGWSTTGCKWVAEHGFNTEEEWGNSQTKNSRALWTPENKAIALTRRITEFVECRSRDFNQQMSLAINGLGGAVGYNRLGHAIYMLDAVEIEPGRFGIRVIDNYGTQNNWCDENGMYIMGSPALATADDCVAIRAITPTTK